MERQDQALQAVLNVAQRLMTERVNALIDLERAHLRIAELEAEVETLKAEGSKRKAEEGKPALREVTKER